MSFSDPASYNQGHQYAVILFNYGQASMQGGRATISQWDPHLAQPADFSLSQIWIMGGQSGTTNWQTIEAGWQKYPQRTGVNGPTFFVFWTKTPSLSKYGAQRNNPVLDSLFDISWRENGGWPEGSVPIVRSILSNRPIIRKNMSFSDPASYNQGHQYAVILFNYGQASMQGGRATISQWDPHLAQPADFSLSQIWIMGGQSGTTNWQTIEAGWQKYPQRTGVNGPTFFVFWTKTPSLSKYGAQRNNPVLDSLFDISWRENGGWPEGSVPIVRSILSNRPIIRKNMSFSDPASYNQGHQYAVILFNYGQASMQGGRATISQWDPHLAQPADFSLSQIWIMGGQSGTTNWQTIEAGWQKYSQRTGVNGPTFFVFWTKTPSLSKYGAQRNNPVLDSLFDISWRENGGWPEGSVPIVRSILSNRPIIRKNMSFSDPASYNQGHQYAVILFNYGQASMQGGRATISQWDPHLAQPADFSLSQIWIMGGQSGTTNWQTIEAGWQKYSQRTGVNGPTFFVFWTKTPSLSKYGAQRNNPVLDSLFDISWRENGGWPEGSVPIVRSILSNRPIIRKNMSFSDPASYNQGHQYAVILFNYGQASMQGGRATISQWDPHLAQPADFSLSQIWIMGGQSGTTNWQTIEAGWQKYPQRTGVNGPTFFVFWTKTPSLSKYGAQRNNPVLDSLFDISWRENGGCPEGSVPIVRSILSNRPIIRKNMSFSDPASYNQGHQYAVILFNYGQASMQGGRATISQWDPHLAQPADFSLSQIWIMGGQSGTTNWQTIEAGWQNYPQRTGVNGPTFFVFWTPDGYSTGGCYDLTCPGWVLTSNQYSPGMTLQSSTYGGQQIELAMDIERDQSTGNWWLYLWGTPIGYWPPSIYNGGVLTYGADTLSWGGEILDSSGSNGFHTLTQMGSGHFPSEGYTRASYVRNIVYKDPNGNANAISQNQLHPQAPAPNCYNYQFQHDNSGQVYFFYGGPGCS